MKQHIVSLGRDGEACIGAKAYPMTDLVLTLCAFGRVRKFPDGTYGLATKDVPSKEAAKALADNGYLDRIGEYYRVADQERFQQFKEHLFNLANGRTGPKPKTNYQRLMAEMNMDRMAGILIERNGCPCCRYYYWDGSKPYCHRDMRDISCEDGVREWLASEETSEDEVYVPDEGKPLFEIPREQYYGLYCLFSSISRLNGTLGEEERTQLTARLKTLKSRFYSPYDRRMDRIYGYYKELSGSGSPTDTVRNVRDSLQAFYPEQDTANIRIQAEALLGNG